MKTIIFYFRLLLPLGLMAILFQGCYTQFVPTRDEDISYQKEQQSAVPSDSSYYGEDNDNWQSHQCLGLSYYYPAWQSYWSWDYGCVYPSYWDPWLWGPAFYSGYSYYPHHWGYGNSYSGYGYGHSNYPRSFATRNSGYLRSGNGRLTGTARSGYAGIGTTYNGRIKTSQGGVNLPRTAGSAVTTRTSRNSSKSVSTVRQRGSWYSPSVQQPRHRDQSTMTTRRSSRTGSSHDRVYSRSQGSSNGQARSSGRSYSPQPSSRTNSTSAPASRNDGGGGRQSGGSGRSR